MKAHKIMNPAPITIQVDAPLHELIKLFNARKIDAACVIDREKRLVGIVTIYELFQAYLPDYVMMKEELAHLMPEGYFEGVCKKIKDHPVSAIMRTDFITVDEDDSLISVLADLVKYRLQVTPVTRNGILIGTIHRKGLLSYTSRICLADTPTSND
ncbi:MAG: CBS domain-containing protein [Deltaproteobacteria bacterium]|nr:CBS domain-containing protein [Deltaproteobacteria bacterium]